jgi:hypothetical protein
MSRVKDLNRTNGEGYAGVFEPSLTMMAQAKKATFSWKKRQFPMECKRCKHVSVFSAAGLAALNRNQGGTDRHNDWVCGHCKKQEAAEVNKAILAVYARKQAMKKSKYTKKAPKGLICATGKGVNQ